MPKPTGATSSGQPSIAAAGSSSRGCHAAQASSTQPVTQPRSVGEPFVYVPTAVS